MALNTINISLNNTYRMKMSYRNNFFTFEINLMIQYSELRFQSFVDVRGINESLFLFCFSLFFSKKIKFATQNSTY